MCALFASVQTRLGVCMAMTRKDMMFLALGTPPLLLSLLALYFFVDFYCGAPYKETEAVWRIRGRCTSDRDGSPIAGAEVTAEFKEPFSFKHHWRSGEPVKATVIVLKTDHEGQFQVAGEGGSVVIKASAEGYLDEEWSRDARNNLTDVAVDVSLVLVPFVAVPTTHTPK